MAKHAAVEQPTARPVAKITAAGVGGAVAAAVLGLAELGDVVSLPPFVAAVLTGVSAFVSGYMKKAHAADV